MNRIVGVFLVAMAVIVAAHTVVEPLYHVSADGQPYSPLWTVLNPLTALAVLLGVMAAWRCKRAVDKEGEDAPVSRAFLIANTLFFGLLFLGILFFWNWFNLLSPGFTAIPPETVTLVWIVIDAALPLLWGATGVALLRGRAAAA